MYAGAFSDPYGWNPTAGLLDLTPGTKPKTFLDTVNPLKLFGLGNSAASPGAAAAPSPPTNGGGAQPSTAAVGPGLSLDENWFRRGVIIILGFIFVAVGLGMFKPTVTAALK